MDDKFLEMPFLKNIGLLMTFKCQVACPHCIIEAGPHRTEEMLPEDTFSWIRQIATYRNGYIKVLSLTGGEPFYQLSNLQQISNFGADCGLFVSAVTNAFWADSPTNAINRLRTLPAIKMLSISADKYHQKFIPFERVRNAVHAAELCGIPCTVAVCTEHENDPAYQAMLQSLREIIASDRILTAITFKAGRALKRSNQHAYQTSTQPPRAACAAGSSPIIFPDGRVVSCIGPIIDLKAPHPLLLGNLRENTLQEILDRAEINPILQAIRIWGPQRLIALSEEAGLKEELPVVYIKESVCHACYDLMANPIIVNFLHQLANDFAFTRKVAYGRIRFFNETRMVELLQNELTNAGSTQSPDSR